ncbi:MAG: hypothetical protein ACE5JP_11475 [Candidatus Bipolaricaulia bacterium]
MVDSGNGVVFQSLDKRARNRRISLAFLLAAVVVFAAGASISTTIKREDPWLWISLFSAIGVIFLASGVLYRRIADRNCPHRVALMKMDGEPDVSGCLVVMDEPQRLTPQLNSSGITWVPNQWESVKLVELAGGTKRGVTVVELPQTPQQYRLEILHKSRKLEIELQLVRRKTFGAADLRRWIESLQADESNFLFEWMGRNRASLQFDLEPEDELREAIKKNLAQFGLTATSVDESSLDKGKEILLAVLEEYETDRDAAAYYGPYSYKVRTKLHIDCGSASSTRLAPADTQPAKGGVGLLEDGREV